MKVILCCHLAGWPDQRGIRASHLPFNDGVYDEYLDSADECVSAGHVRASDCIYLLSVNHPRVRGYDVAHEHVRGYAPTAHGSDYVRGAH